MCLRHAVQQHTFSFISVSLKRFCHARRLVFDILTDLQDFIGHCHMMLHVFGQAYVLRFYKIQKEIVYIRDNLKKQKHDMSDNFSKNT